MWIHARAAPPEIAADAMLQVVESTKVSDKASRRALIPKTAVFRLIEDAFKLAAAAQWKAPMRAARSLPAESHEFYLAKAYGLNLDALSLQTRAAKDMLALDKPAARDLFLAIPHPVFAPTTCEAALIPDPSPLYQTLGAIVSQGFTQAERAKDEHVHLLLAYIGQIASPLETEPLGAVIASAGLTPEQSRALHAEFDAAVEAMKNQSGPVRCAGDFALHTDAFWQSPAAKVLVQRAIDLRFQNGASVTPADRAGREWQQKLTDLVKDLADWGPGQENSEADFFHEKVMIYEALLELTPPGPERGSIREALVRFLASSNLQTQSPAEWLFQASSVILRLQNTDDGEPARLLEAYEASGNPALAVYTALGRAFRGPERTESNPFRTAP